mmetsp:Transcript_43710/g.105415  ORF Transcript_43710/g.105415 Transcript_43710/m.105415 type:complete len:119 (-) Transcript_43710:91-447(-)
MCVPSINQPNLLRNVGVHGDVLYVQKMVDGCKSLLRSRPVSHNSTIYSMSSIILEASIERFVDPAAAKNSVCSFSDRQSSSWPIFFNIALMSSICRAPFSPTYGRRTSFLKRLGISLE